MGEIYVGTFGRGIWSSDAYLGVENQNTIEQDLGLNLLVYPNPSKGLSTLNYSLVKNSSVKVNIYSFNGQLIKSVDMKHLNAGNHSIDLPSNDLPKGTYIIQLQTSYKSETTKFIKY